MIKLFFFLLIIYISLIGFSIYFIDKILRLKKKEFYNLDILYGIFFVILLAIISNFFIPLIYLGIIFVPIGLILIFLFFKKYVFKINFFSYFLILFFFIFISYSNQLVGDSNFYHLQTIKWFSEFKLSFGLANLEPRYGLNSLWHIFLSIFNFSILEINLIYHVNLIIYAIVFNEIFSFKNKNMSKLSYIYLFFTLSMLLTYSFIHPMKNGTIFYNLGSPEVDTLAMIFFILSGFLFLKIYEIKKKIDYIPLLIITISLTYLTKLSYIFSILFFVILLIQFKKLYKTKIVFLALFLNFIWLLRNFIISGCGVFPLKFTCLNFSWAFNQNDIDIFSKIIRSFARDTPMRDKYMDFNYTLETGDWFLPWFNSYFLETSLLIILSLISIIFIFLIILAYFLGKKIDPGKNYFYFLSICFLSSLLWLQAPEIRFGYGYLISLSTLIVSLFYFIIIKKIKFINNKIFNLIIILLFAANIQKNIQNFNKLNLNIKYNFNYNNFELVQKNNNFEIYKPPPTVSCGFFPKICVYEESEYLVESYLNYLIFKRVE